MPSPFPGFDPYLESPLYWRSFHNSYVYTLGAALNAVLPAPFVARTEVRVYIAMQQQSIYPDVAVLRPQSVPATERGGTATLGRAAAPLVISVERDEVNESYINIVRASSPDAVITTLELLSPANKAPGREGQEPYVRKQQTIVRSATHLLEIDLLRAGLHSVAVPRELVQQGRQGAEWDYLVSLHRVTDDIRHSSFEVWPFTLREAMPIVRVPLADGFPDAELDLCAAFDRVYDEGRYTQVVRYSQQADPPLAPEDAAWADDLLQRAGFRPRVG